MMTKLIQREDDHIHEECGVFGVYSTAGSQVAMDIYDGLIALHLQSKESICSADALSFIS